MAKKVRRRRSLKAYPDRLQDRRTRRVDERRRDHLVRTCHIWMSLSQLPSKRSHQIVMACSSHKKERYPICEESSGARAAAVTLRCDFLFRICLERSAGFLSHTTTSASHFTTPAPISILSCSSYQTCLKLNMPLSYRDTTEAVLIERKGLSVGASGTATVMFNHLLRPFVPSNALVEVEAHNMDRPLCRNAPPNVYCRSPFHLSLVRKFAQ